MRLKIIAAFAIVLGGCVPTSFYTRPMPLAEQADQFNRAASEAQRLMIVRNVMRARDRNSMIFTRISAMRGSMTRTQSGTLGFTLREGPHNDESGPTITMSGESAPSFDFAVMDDEKFNRAMQSSLDLGIYQLLLEYGWKADVIGSLFIESVTLQIEPGDGATRTLRNDPSHWGDYSAFHTWLSGNLTGDNKLQVCEGADPTTFGPPINIAPTPDLGDLAAFATAKLRLQSAQARRVAEHPELTPAARRELLQQPQTGPWRVQLPDATRWIDLGCAPHVTRTFGSEYTNEDSHLRAQMLTQTPPVHLQDVSQGPSRERVVEIRMRSIQGALVYLGEVVRAEEQHSDHVVRVNGAEPLFHVHRGHCALGLNFVHEDGAEYSIPYRAGIATSPTTCEPALTTSETLTGDETDRTQQVISLMLQLVGMLQSREAVPATGAVQVVN